MERSPEFLQEFANRLARILTTEVGSQSARALYVAGMLGDPCRSDLGRTGNEGVSSCAKKPRVGIWQRCDQGGQDRFVRASNVRHEWGLWANVGCIEPKRSKRVALVGESAARGFLYDPQFTPAMALSEILKSQLGQDAIEVIDLARTNLGFEVRELALSALLLEPDAVVIFAGNNWRFSLSDVKDVAYLDGILKEEGVSGLKRFFERGLTDKVKALVGDVAGTYAANGVPLIWVIPEFNLGDWSDPVVDAPHLLACGANRDWILQRQVGNRALGDGDLNLARRAATRMVELDGGVSVAGLYLLAECSRRTGDLQEQRKLLESARDALIWDSSAPVSPRAYSVTQKTLREMAAQHQNDIVDLPKLFKDYLGGQIPDRRLFLDYCHMTLDGINVAMMAVACKVLKALDSDVVQSKQLGYGRQVPAQTRGEASFLAAVHNGHWGQSHDLIHYYCTEAVRLCPSLARSMLHFIELQTRRAPMLMCRSAEQIAASGLPLIKHYLLRYDNQQLNQILIDAIISVLHKVGVVAKKDLGQLRREERGVAVAPVNLLDYYYGSSVGQPQEAKWATPWLQHKGADYYKAYSPMSRFLFVGEAARPVQLSITCRLPIRSVRKRMMIIEVNGKHCAELSLAHQWKTFHVIVAKETVSDGINQIQLKWPPALFRGTEAIRLAVDNILKGTAPELYCTFGEIHSFTASDASYVQRGCYESWCGWAHEIQLSGDRSSLSSREVITRC